MTSTQDTEREFMQDLDTEEAEEEQELVDYIKQHYEAEEETMKQLLNLEKEFRTHHVLMTKELQQQDQWCSRLWTLSQRYVLLLRSVYQYSPTESLTFNDIESLFTALAPAANSQIFTLLLQKMCFLMKSPKNSRALKDPSK